MSAWNDFRNWLMAFTALIVASYGCGRADRANVRLDVIEQKLENSTPPTPEVPDGQ